MTENALLQHRLPAGAQLALAQLGKARALARETESDPWQFALSLTRLVQLGACESVLRWLALNGYVACAEEQTTVTDSARRFLGRNNLAFTGETCFVMCEKGGSLTFPDLELSHSTPPPPPQVPDSPWIISIGACLPHWDGVRRMLSFDGDVVKQFRYGARNQELVLAAFQEENWPFAIDDPLPPSGDLSPKRRLNETIRALNSNQILRAVRFRGDGTGERVCWEPSPIGDLSAALRRRAA